MGPGDQIWILMLSQQLSLQPQKHVGVETATGAQVTYKFLYPKDGDSPTLSSHQIPITAPLRVGLTPSPIELELQKSLFTM